MSEDRIDKLAQDFIRVINKQNDVIKSISEALDGIHHRMKLQQSMIISLQDQIESIANATILKPKIYKKTDESN